MKSTECIITENAFPDDCNDFHKQKLNRYIKSIEKGGGTIINVSSSGYAVVTDKVLHFRLSTVLYKKNK